MIDVVDRASLTEWAERGATLTVIADAFGVSISTVRYWLRGYDLEQLRRARRGAAAPGGAKHVDLVWAFTA